MDTNATITGDCTVTTDLHVTTDADVGGTLDVTGIVTTITDATVGGDLTVTGDLGVTGITNFLPAGVFTWYTGTSAPSGWLACDGAAVSRSTYSALFAVVGSTFGAGDGATTFNVPNVARNTIVGSGGSGTGTLGNTVADTGGTETHTLTTAQIPAHTHTFDLASSVTGTGGYKATGAVTTNSAATITTYSGGGSGGSHNILQPSLIMFGIIRAV